MSLSRDSVLRLIKATESTHAGNEIADAINLALALGQARGTAGNIRADGSVVFLGDQSMNGHKLTNLANPTSSQDAATKSYVDLNGNGSVTSVALSLPASIFNVSGSPVTVSGTLTGSLLTQSANLVWAGPTTGSAATPTFRSLVVADIPSLPYLSNASGSASFFMATPSGSSGSPSLRAIVSADIPTLNQNTTGSAAKWTTARNLAGNSVDGSANVAFSNKFIVQGIADAGLSGAQFLGALSTGILKNTTTTGVLSIAVAGDFPTLNQNTTGLSANVTGIVALANGGTGLNSASLNALLNSLLPNQSTNAGKFLTTDGTNTSWASAGSSGANVHLSNLSVVDINSDLLTSSAVNIGSFALLFNNIYVAQVSSDNFTGLNPGTGLSFQPMASTDPGTSGGISFLTAQPLSGEDSGPIENFTHNVSGGTAQSGSVTNSSGSSAGGNSGENNLRTGNAVISGDINIETGSGSTHRGDVRPSGRRIIITADEYVESNADIKPSDGSQSLGSLAIGWANVWAAQFWGTLNTLQILSIGDSADLALATVDTASGSSGNIDFTTGTSGDGTGSGGFNFTSANNSGNASSGDFKVHLGNVTGGLQTTGIIELFTGNNTSGSGSVKATGGIHLKTGTTSGTGRGIIELEAKRVKFTVSDYIDANSATIRNLNNPTLTADAATKDYVDNTANAPYKQLSTLNGTDITNQYKDLDAKAKDQTMFLSISGVVQYEGLDYSLSVVGGVTRVTFLGDLATGGLAALVSGDILRTAYIIANS